MSDKDGKYALKYSFKHKCGKFAAQPGTADALILVSVVFHDDGCVEILPLSIDGRTGEAMNREDLKAVLKVAAAGSWNRPVKID